MIRGKMFGNFQAVGGKTFLRRLFVYNYTHLYGKVKDFINIFIIIKKLVV